MISGERQSHQCRPPTVTLNRATEATNATKPVLSLRSLSSQPTNPQRHPERAKGLLFPATMTAPGEVREHSDNADHNKFGAMNATIRSYQHGLSAVTLRRGRVRPTLRAVLIQRVVSPDRPPIRPGGVALGIIGELTIANPQISIGQICDLGINV